MSDWLTLSFPCRILTRSKSARTRLRRIEKRTYCDSIDPLEYECARCHCTWGDAVLTDYREVTCSNCYSDRVLLVNLRLTFHNWGNQNGGKKEQRERYDAARMLADAAPDAKASAELWSEKEVPHA